MSAELITIAKEVSNWADLIIYDERMKIKLKVEEVNGLERKGLVYKERGKNSHSELSWCELFQLVFIFFCF